MIPVVAFTKTDLNEIATRLYNQIDFNKVGDQKLRTYISSTNADGEISAIYFSNIVVMDKYEAIDENCRDMVILENDLESIEEIINDKIEYGNY